MYVYSAWRVKENILNGDFFFLLNRYNDMASTYLKQLTLFTKWISGHKFGVHEHGFGNIHDCSEHLKSSVFNRGKRDDTF